MKRILTIIAVVALSTFFASAQSSSTGGNKKIYATMSFEVNGVKMYDEELTLSTFTKKFGRPTKTTITGNETSYEIGESGFTLIDNKLAYVLICNKDMVVLGNYIPGGIKVGDKASEVKDKIKKYTYDSTIDFDNGLIKGFIIGDWDDRINCNVDDSGYITQISYGIE